MKNVLRAMLFVFSLDMLAASVLVRSWTAGGLLLLACAFAWPLRFKAAPKSAAIGWDLGPAIELTNPERPTRLKSAFIHPRFLNLGMLIMGGPGSGKTISSLAYIKSIRTWSPSSGWVYYEGKGDTDIFQMCVAMGCPPDHFFSSELPGSDSMNLFEGEARDVIDRLLKVLVGESASTTFYSDEQRTALTLIIPLLRALPEPTNLRDLYVSLCVQDAGNDLLRRAKEAGANPVALEMAREWLAVPMKDRVKNIKGLLNRLFIFVYGEEADRINAYQPDINIAQLVANNETLYLHLPLSSFARDLAIAIIETFGVVAKSRQLGGTKGLTIFPQLFDDWGAFFHSDFGPYAARCRSAAMPLSFGFQSTAQMDEVAPTFRNNMDDNIATKISMRIQGQETADFVVTLMGQYDALDVGTSARKGGGVSQDGDSLRFIEKDRVRSRELRELEAGEAFVSTLQSIDGKMSNPLWKLRIPMPDVEGFENVPLPAAKKHEEGVGLGFWNRYMNPSALAEIHALVQSDIDAASEELIQKNIEAQDEARSSIETNPGFSTT